ncbi:DUF1684 domain-containing protein [Flavobacterium rhizosphaerae]|uniref:DUF1684 domain-containing protein n=1 Tax=Flavobacterium rhizosphaerae TaxID=3163298 RepID=A0ABW8YU89_9FLAO
MKLIITLIALAATLTLKAQECSEQTVKKWQQEINGEYADATTSPLIKKDLKKFQSLDFYPVDMQYCVTAKLVRTPNEKPFDMATTTARTSKHVKYGELHFTLKGKKCRLDVFRNLELARLDKYKDYLFLPFTDLSSGEESYGGGRYIDLKMPTKGDTLQVDFNTAYNPYCAYNHEYSCPIPPSQNYLEVDVKAGVKAFKKK